MRDVVDVLLQCNDISEIIVVDDGSDLESRRVVEGLPAQVHRHYHVQNKGKAAAMLTGLLACQGDFVAFVDADLRNLKPEHVSALCRPVLRGFADMSLGRRQYEAGCAKLMAPAYTGERCFKRSRLLGSVTCFDVQRYGIEAALNKEFFRHGNVVVVPLRGVAQTSKRIKAGIFMGAWRSCKMLMQMACTVGCMELVYQVAKAARLPVVGAEDN